MYRELISLLQGAYLFPKTRTFTALIQLSDISSVCSYTSVAHVLSKMCFLVHAFPFSLDTKYVFRNNSKCEFPCIFALGAMLLQLIMCFACLQLQFSHSIGGTKEENWKPILLTFFLGIFTAVVFILFHLLRVRNEAVCLLNSSDDMEKKYRKQG